MPKDIESRCVDEVILNRGHKPIGVNANAAIILKKHIIRGEKTPLKRKFVRHLKFQSCLRNDAKIVAV